MLCTFIDVLVHILLVLVSPLKTLNDLKLIQLIWDEVDGTSHDLIVLALYFTILARKLIVVSFSSNFRIAIWNQVHLCHFQESLG